jgi:hypothetical protein
MLSHGDLVEDGAHERSSCHGDDSVARQERRAPPVQPRSSSAIPEASRGGTKLAGRSRMDAGSGDPGGWLDGASPSRLNAP